MRIPLLVTAVLLAACQHQAPLPAGYTVPPPAAPTAAAPSAAGGTPEQQAARVLRRDFNQDRLRQRENAADGEAPAPTGEPGYAPFDQGGEGQMPVIPGEVSPAFRGL
ncbi:hypothetical protein GWK16_10930 [Roseomonas sp. JC162]|uniref:Lipoprotein n=1 Tax=Neoroseomonas marina TaxID=1232220 RepID=A0A848EEJ5_9PROT|nr:hypothetical protein [Neoroseomonas marina]NMJ41758.1 hypothetical protein [Neoroseomonas marina]